ncbi:DUF881 domain-containing protein [Clostridium carnis]
MKRLNGKIFIFIASIAVGVLIVTNINLNLTRTPSVAQLNTVEYKKAVDERNKLYKDIEVLRNDNSQAKYKINKYSGNDNKKEKLIDDMKRQLLDYGMLNGSIDLKGPGLIIKINDGDYNRKLETQFDVWRKTLHDNDMALVLNDIRKAGAEAISINNHRVIGLTGVNCNWAFIGFEDDSMEGAPFYIYAIGDPGTLKAALLAEDSHIQKLARRKLKVEIEEKAEILVPATIQNMDVKYMERYDVK